MISMKTDKEEAEEACCLGQEQSPYPYGLELRLDDGSLMKLGYSEPPKVGSVLTIKALVTVTESSQRETQDSDPEFSSCWQITDMEVSGASRSTDTLASLMYPEK